MSRMTTFAALLLIALFGVGVGIWRPWERAPQAGGVQINFTEPDPATACSVACVNKTDQEIDGLEIVYSGEGLKLTSMAGGSGGPIVRQHSPEGGRTRIPIGLKPGERRICHRFYGKGQIDSVTWFVGDKPTPHSLTEPLIAGGSLVLGFLPDGKISVTRE